MEGLLQNAMQGTEKGQSQNISQGQVKEQKPKIKVAGIGGGGNNTVDRIASKGMPHVNMIAINTDQVHLNRVASDKKIQIGEEITQGRGAGGSPKVGRRSAENSYDKIRKSFEGSDLVFLACGLGGGTGTGGAPVIARAAKETGAVVTGVVTIPFSVEQRDKIAKKGLKNLREHADSVIVIDNNRLSDMAAGMPMRYAFTMADEVLSRMLGGLVETIMMPSLINLDFADVKSIMEEDNIIMVGTGEASGENRAEKSVKQALSCPLLGNVDYSTAEGVIIHVSGADVSVKEAERIVEFARDQLNHQSETIWGSRIDRSLGDTLQTILLISGASSPHLLGSASDGGVESLGESSCKEAETPLNLNLDHL